MPWTKKTKIPQGTKRGRILTPDYCQILVGESSDEILIYQILATFWNLKNRIVAGASTLKTKIAAGSYSLKTKIEP